MQDRPADWHALHGLFPVHFMRRMLQGLHLSQALDQL
jgi:hypothetical protein